MRVLHASAMSGRLKIRIQNHLRQHGIRAQHTFDGDSRLPRIAQSSLWETVFPKSLRARSREILTPFQGRTINPASYFIWIYILIGSQAIRILGIQNEYKTYMRQADVKIGKLREVIGKLQRGEIVDVEKELGVGDEEQEQEWEKALREIENEERVWQEHKKKLGVDQERLETVRADANPVNDTAKSESFTVKEQPTTEQPPRTTLFY